MPSPRCFAPCLSLENQLILVVCGFDGSNVTQEIFEYSVQHDEWSQHSETFIINGHASVSVFNSKDYK